MNQAALHKLLSSKEKAQNLDGLFELRLATNLTLIKDLFFSLYLEENHSKTFQKLLDQLPKLFKSRPENLKQQDVARLEIRNWYQSERIVGTQLYVDHFNKDLKGLHEKLSYFEDLGINFLHLMPITTRPKGENDGGYAVNSYTQIDKKYGTQKDFAKLTAELQKREMFLMLDFVVNHTSNEYPWAKKAIAGNKKYQDYYYTYSDRNIPDEFEKTLPEIFPETAPGNYTYVPEMDKWAMTCFNSYQWDLNYTNPEVFLEMLTNLVNLANLGVDVVRFDALAFLWKKMGTISQNLPEAHKITALFRMCLQVVAPGTVLLAEAIVAPTNIIKYFGEGNRTGNECEIAYNASLMALLWNSIATKRTSLLHKSLTNIPQKPKDCTWINYIRCHDDIGLGLDDRFIQEMGWNPNEHRKFLLNYYCQKLDWSPAKGMLFMYNPKTGDGRITGSAASLLGLEKALEENDDKLVEEAVNKIIMLHGIILSFGGIPLIYAGDEIATLNDYSFLEDKNKKGDSRWVNRPYHNWGAVSNLKSKNTPQGKVFFALKKLIALRKKHSFFADSNNLELFHFGNEHILIFERKGQKKNGVLVICNFNNSLEVIDGGFITKLGYLKNQEYKDLISNKKTKLNSGFLELNPYQLLWLEKI
ncbi:alpha-amylase family glycosyl hydrolase [Croceitalea sp. MTPC9]|uniref:amylosucrase n=1 Tax=unclassified Croceitalea TaxID=2632280 RepID=UPI002B3D2575|nr:alpha-amylase family glycosyl hydrolase [Croceitalea sp. MTPC6]GMN16772.1 alpha-amylase family glycosyl hydrolase [Croceitalea sp. MTPC9]